MSWLRCSLILAFAVMLSACGSTPRSEYYMLSAGVEEIAGTGGPSLGVGPIQIPAYLQRKEMILNRDRNTLSMHEYHRWAEPLEAGISRVVSLNLAALLETHQVQYFPWRRDALPDYGISILVVQFAVHDLQANLIAEWTLSAPSDKKVLVSRISHFRQSLRASEPQLIAAAYSKLLMQLSREIAGAIK